MTYTVAIRRRAAKALASLPVQDFERVRDAVRALAETPRLTVSRNSSGGTPGGSASAGTG